MADKKIDRQKDELIRYCYIVIVDYHKLKIKQIKLQIDGKMK